MEGRKYMVHVLSVAGCQCCVGPGPQSPSPGTGLKLEKWGLWILRLLEPSSFTRRVVTVSNHFEGLRTSLPARRPGAQFGPGRECTIKWPERHWHPGYTVTLSLSIGHDDDRWAVTVLTRNPPGAISRKLFLTSSEICLRSNPAKKGYSGSDSESESFWCTTQQIPKKTPT